MRTKQKKALESAFFVSCIDFVLTSQNKPISQIDCSGPLLTGQGKGEFEFLKGNGFIIIRFKLIKKKKR